MHIYIYIYIYISFYKLIFRITSGILEEARFIFHHSIVEIHDISQLKTADRNDHWQL